MSRNAPEGDSGNGGLPHPYTLSLPANRAAATWTNEPGCRERIGTLNKRLIFSAFEKELCRAYDSPEKAADAVIAWLVCHRGLSEKEALNTEVETAIDLLQSTQDPAGSARESSPSSRSEVSHSANTVDDVVWHGPHDAPPAEFKDHGPLTGQKKQLAKWILTPSGRQDPRSLDTLMKSGQFWGRKDGRRSFAVWFLTASRYSEANSMKLGDQFK